MPDPPDNSRSADRLSFFLAINEQRKHLVEGGSSQAVFTQLAELTRIHFESDSVAILSSGAEEFSSPLLGAAGISDDLAAPIMS